jgi:hypothetical protein
LGRLPLDVLDHLLVQLEAGDDLMQAFSKTCSLQEVIALAESIGIVATQRQLLDLMCAHGDHQWYCGGKDFNPVLHLQSLVGAQS